MLGGQMQNQSAISIDLTVFRDKILCGKSLKTVCRVDEKADRFVEIVSL